MNVTGISLFTRNGVYYITYTEESGRRRQKTTKCTRRSDAMRVLSDFKKFLNKKPFPKSISFSAFTRDYLQYAESNLSASTVNIYLQSFRHFLRIHGDMALTTITPKHWDTFKTVRLSEHVPPRRKYNTAEETARAQERQRRVSAVTVHIELRALRAAMNTALRWQWISHNPFEKLQTVSIPKKTPAFLTLQDADRLLAVISRQCIRDVIIFAINTGMRRGEILSLRWKDIDKDSRVARITNREDFTTKTGEERLVALNDAAIAVLNRCRASRRHEYIFSLENGRRITPDFMTHHFKVAVRKAGLAEGLHMHSTRHSFASLLVGSGTSLFTVSKLLGHSSSRTSEIYSHLLPQHLRQEVEKLNVGNEPSSLKT